MDTQNSSVADAPQMKLAKVGKDRERKRGGGGWLGARGAGSGFSGAMGEAGTGMGGVFGTGMSLAKLLTVLLVSAGVSAGAWKAGNMIAANSPAAKSAAPQVFDTKDSGKYADTSGVIKQENTIPNSLGYVNNDGLTDEQRAAKKAADQAAAAKAAADAQAQADADAKAKALADAKAAAAANAADAHAAHDAATPGGSDFKKGLAAGKFGGMQSSFGGGGGGLSGGAGLSGGINRSFGAMGNLGNKNAGALSAFTSPSRIASSKSAGRTPTKSNAKGFARQQLDNAFGQSRQALATGKSEDAAAGAAAPFDNNPSQGSVISGPGLNNGAQTGPADTAGSTNQQEGDSGGPLTSGAACGTNQEPDINGNCQSTIQTPPAQNGAAYQGLINACLILLAIVAVLSAVCLVLSKEIGYGTLAAEIIGWVISAIGAAICAMGATIAMMKHGDFMIGAILTGVGGFICVQGAMSAMGCSALNGGAMGVADIAVPDLLATAAGMLAAGATQASSLM